MPIITISDLTTNIYGEIISEVTRNDDTIAQNAIDTAIAEAKMYLGRYDLLQLFGDETTTPVIHDDYLTSLVKDLACWHLLRLANTSADYTAFRTAYQDAVAVLKNIMAGQAQPQGWPYLDTSTSPPTPEGDAISWTSNPRRSNYF